MAPTRRRRDPGWPGAWLWGRARTGQPEGRPAARLRRHRRWDTSTSRSSSSSGRMGRAPTPQSERRSGPVGPRSGQQGAEVSGQPGIMKIVR